MIEKYNKKKVSSKKISLVIIFLCFCCVEPKALTQQQQQQQKENSNKILIIKLGTGVECLYWLLKVDSNKRDFENCFMMLWLDANGIQLGNKVMFMLVSQNQTMILLIVNKLFNNFMFYCLSKPNII